MADMLWAWPSISAASCNVGVGEMEDAKLCPAHTDMRKFWRMRETTQGHAELFAPTQGTPAHAAPSLEMCRWCRSCSLKDRLPGSQYHHLPSLTNSQN